MTNLKNSFKVGSILFIVIFFILTSCKKDSCKICTQMVSEKYIPNRDGYPKTSTSRYNSCGDANSWIGNQFNMETYKLHDTTYYKAVTTDCE